MDVWTYFEQRERECARLSLAPEPGSTPLYLALEGADGMRGRIAARLALSDRAYIDVMERVVVVDGSHVHREEYSYFLIVDGAEVYGRERDPTHDPAEHGHGRHHVREDAGAVSFVAFVENCWEIVSDLGEPVDLPAPGA